jgi:WS/DGAT/MGAT family acyltransferase
VHHSLTDGVGGIELAGHVVDLHRTPRHLGPPPEVPGARAHNPVEELADAVGFDLRRAAGFAAGGMAKLPGAVTRAVADPLGTAAGVATTAAAVARFVRPITRTLSPVMTGRRLQWKYQVFDVPVADLRRAAKAVDSTLNDAFLAAVAGGMRRYHHGHGAHVPELRVTMPISVRNDGDALGGNRITLMRFAVPVGTADPAARMRALRTTVGEVRRDKALPFTTAVAGILNMLPPSATASMLKHVDFLASNVPGFDKPVYLAGARVDAFYALGPTTGTAANITLMSYRGTAHIGVNTDLGAVPDPDEFLRCLQEGFAEVIEVGAELPPRSEGRTATLVS